MSEILNQRATNIQSVSTVPDCGHFLCVSDGSFRTYIQPIFSLSDLSTFGYEVLNRPIGFSTEVFYDEIVTCGCFNQVDILLVDKALQIAAHFPGPIFINVYPTSLISLPVTDIRYKNVVFELNERQLWFAACDVISAISRRGLTIAVDDMGKGGSGLQSLVEMNPQFLKIDRWLVSGIQYSKRKQDLVRLLATYASGRCKIIAEGIEHKEELDVIKNLGVDYGQGFLLSEPQLIK